LEDVYRQPRTYAARIVKAKSPARGYGDMGGLILVARHRDPAAFARRVMLIQGLWSLPPPLVNSADTAGVMDVPVSNKRCSEVVRSVSSARSVEIAPSLGA
jgi:hypothetical protein